MHEESLIYFNEHEELLRGIYGPSLPLRYVSLRGFLFLPVVCVRSLYPSGKFNNTPRELRMVSPLRVKRGMLSVDIVANVVQAPTMLARLCVSQLGQNALNDEGAELTLPQLSLPLTGIRPEAQGPIIFRGRIVLCWRRVPVRRYSVSAIRMTANPDDDIVVL